MGQRVESSRSVDDSRIEGEVVVSVGRRGAAIDAEDVKAFLSDLAVQQRVSASTQNQALAALLLDPERLVVSLLYGSGMRILECVSLRVKDIDCERREITIRGGKGDKDRRVPLAASAVPDVQRALRIAREVWRRDRAGSVRTTGIAPGLSRKIPSADADWSWYYLFPASRTFTDAARVVRRHHLHATQVQRTVPGYRASGGNHEARDMPRIQAFVRHAPARKRHRHSNDPGVAGPSESFNDDDLHPRVESGRLGST